MKTAMKQWPNWYRDPPEVICAPVSGTLSRQGTIPDRAYGLNPQVIKRRLNAIRFKYKK